MSSWICFWSCVGLAMPAGDSPSAAATLPVVQLATRPGVQPPLVQPFAGEFDPQGRFYFVEMTGGERLRRVDPDGNVFTLAGTGKKGFQRGTVPAMQAEFQGMHNLARTRDGRLYLADTFNHAIRLYDPATQTVATIAGNGQPGFAGDDGPVSPETVQFRQPICIALNDEETQLFIADIGNRRVRVMDLKTNQIRTIAGNGQKGVPQDGQPAREQPLTDPRAVSQDRQGRLYILERGGHRLYRLEPDGKILAVAGTGKPGRTGDGGPALQAAMNGPKYLVCDANGLVLIADTENHQIRAFDPEKQTLRTLVGTGQPGAGGLGQGPLQVQLKRPHGVVRHPKTGELWIADSDNQRILRVAVP